MTHPLRESDEKESEFLKRMEALDWAGGGQISINSKDLQTLIALARHWRRLETEAASRVESVICLRSRRFTGEPPYVGWKGLGLALSQDYDELDRLRPQ